MKRVWRIDWFYSKLSAGLLDGGLAGAKAMNEIKFSGDLNIPSRPIVGSAKVGWVVDLHRGEYFLLASVAPLLDSQLRWVDAIQASLNSWLEGGGRRLVYSIWRSCNEHRWRDVPKEEPPEALISSYAVVVSAVVLLSLVYQYRTGNVDIGSSKASRSSLGCRDNYVAIVLFLGAYVWIKFREVACKGVYRREIKRKGDPTPRVVFEPRFKPPRENGKVLQWIYLGQYATPEEASILYQIAAFYYNNGQGGSLALEGGRCLCIPPMSEENRSFTGNAKRDSVKVQALKVYEDFRKEDKEKEKGKGPLLQQELSEACEDQVTLEQDKENVDNPLFYAMRHFLKNYRDEHRQPALASKVEDLGMGTPMRDRRGWERASQSVGGMHEEESALPISQLTPDTQSGMGINKSKQLNLHELVQNLQELITYHRHQISLLQNQQFFQQQQLKNSMNRISQLESQILVLQELQLINQGVPRSEAEMEQSMPQENHLYDWPSGEAEAQLDNSWLHLHM